MRVLGKPELSNAIKLVDLETLMANFGPPSPRAEFPQQNLPSGKHFEEDEQEVRSPKEIGNA